MGEGDNAVMLWEVATGKLRQTLIGHSDAVIRVAFSADEQTLTSVGTDRLAIVWDLATGEERFVLQMPGFGVSGLSQQSTASDILSQDATNSSATLLKSLPPKPATDSGTVNGNTLSRKRPPPLAVFNEQW